MGGNKFYTINEANKILRDVIGDGETVYLEERHEAKDAHSTWDKSVDLLGYGDKTSLENGLKSMWEWTRMQPSRSRFHWGEYELNKGIYEYWRNK